MIRKVSHRDFVLQSLGKNFVKEHKSEHYLLLIKAEWCPHCRDYKPLYENLSAQHPQVGFLMMDSDESDQLLSSWGRLARPAFQVNGFPTLVLYDDRGTPVKVIKDRFNPIAEI